MSLADALTKEALIVDGSSAWKLGKSASTDSTIETATISTYERRGFRATTIIPTCSLEALDLLFSTPGNNQLYEPAITQETTIEDDIADRCRLVHTKFGQQGMVSARDFVTRHATRVVDRSFASAVEKLLINESGGGATAGASGKVFIFATKSVEDDRRIPQQPNCVRGVVYMHTFIGIPLLGAHDVSGVKLLYISCVDPKGSIPAFALEGGWAAESATKLARIRDLATLIENLMVNAKHVQRHHLLLTALSPVPTQPRESLQQTITARESLVMGSTRASAAHAGGPEECLAQPTFADAKVIPLPVPQKIQPTQQQTTEEEEETVAADQLPQQRATLPPTQNNSRSTVRPAPSSRPISVREEIVTETPLPPAVTPEAQPSISTLIRLHRSQTWAPSKTLENCLLEELTTNVFGGGVDRKVLRISSTFQCTIGTFSEFLADTSQVSKYDPAIDTFEVVSESPAGVVLYTSYKRQTRLVEPRDFCTVTARAELDRTDALAQGLGSCAGAFVQCSTNSKDRGAVKGLVRGIVHIFGYVALTESELALGGAATNTTGGGKSSSIQVFNILCVDPSGSIPKWLVDAASADSCKKLATIRRLCEERQKTIPGALPRRLSIRKSTSQPSAAAASTLPTKKKQHTDPNDQDATQPTNSSPTADSLSASNSSMAFHSCVDEQEVMEQQEHLRDFYESEVQEVVEHLILLHRAHGWEVQKTVNDIRLETMTTSFCDKKAIKIACEFKCTLETFRTVISSVDYIRKYNTTLNELEALDSPPYGTVMYTSYKSNSKIIQPRDFCTLTAAKLLSEEEGSEAGLYTKGFHAAAFVVSSINSTDKPPQPDYVRGTVHAHGYIAVAVPPNASRIRVFNVSLVDPMGSIPAKLVDAAVTETVKQMDVLRNICEKVQQAGGPRVAVPSTIVPDRGSVSQSSATASSSTSASSEFPAVDEVPILRKLARVHTSNDWVDPRYFGKVQGMWSPSDVDPEVPVLKFATEIMCSLDAFARFVTTSDHLRKVDPELDVVKYLEGPPNATISYTSHSSQHKVLPSTDLVQLSVNKTFQGDEGSDLGLYTKGITSAAFIQNAVNWSIKDDNNKQGSSKLNRAVVQYLGFVAIATPATARRIRVFHYVSLGNVSALRCGGGGGAAQKPKDSVFVDIANRLTRMAVFCEQVQRDIDAAAMEPVEQRATSSSQHQEEATTDTTPTKQLINDESNVDSPQPAIAEQESGTQASTAAAAADADDTTLVVVSRNQLDIYARLIDLQRKKDWAMGKVVERCLLETTTVSYCSKKAVRISTEMHCSLRTFAAFLDDVSQVRVMDPNLDRFDITDRHSDGTVEIYTSYQQQTRFVAPRDFFTLTSRNLLEADEVVAQPLIASIVPVGHCAVIQNSKSIGGHLPPAGSNLVRGIVSVHGFFATAATLDATKIRVFNISCVDPSGSIPNWVIEAANAEACKKLALMRQLCEELQKNL